MINKNYQIKCKVLINRFFRTLTKQKLIAGSIIIIGFLSTTILTNKTPQSAVFTFGAFALTANLLPTMVDKEREVVRWTTIPTAIVIFGFSVSFFTNGLYLSASGNFINFLAWTFLAVFRGPSIEEGELQNI